MRLEPRAGFGLAATALPIRHLRFLRNFPTNDADDTRTGLPTLHVYDNVLHDSGCTVTVSSVDWAGFEGWLMGQGYERKYVRDVLCYAKRFEQAFLSGDVAELARGGEHALKGVACLSKYLGCYERFKVMKSQSGGKWYSKSSEEVFMEMFEGKETVTETEKWIDSLKGKVPKDIWIALCFMAMSGLRTQEAIDVLNLIGTFGLQKYPSKGMVLEHFRVKGDDGKRLFLRRTKKAFLTPLTVGMEEILKNWHGHLTYKKIRVNVKKAGVSAELYRLRKWHCTVLRTAGVAGEIVDMLEGRVPLSILGQSYLRPDIVSLFKKVRDILEPYERKWLG